MSNKNGIPSINTALEPAVSLVLFSGFIFLISIVRTRFTIVNIINVSIRPPFNAFVITKIIRNA